MSAQGRLQLVREQLAMEQPALAGQPRQQLVELLFERGGPELPKRQAQVE